MHVRVHERTPDDMDKLRSDWKADAASQQAGSGGGRDVRIESRANEAIPWLAARGFAKR